jgi:hypothetical protein
MLNADAGLTQLTNRKNADAGLTISPSSPAFTFNSRGLLVFLSLVSAARITSIAG